MKKVAIVVLILCMLFMTACGTPTPTDALKADIENAKNNPEEIIGDVGEDGFGEEATEALVNKVLEFDYELGEEVISEDGQTATVEATITTYPFGDVFSTLMTNLFAEVFANPNMTDEELATRMDTLLIQGLENAEKTYSKTVTITLEMEDGAWVVQEDDAMADALTGGMLSWANSMNS